MSLLNPGILWGVGLAVIPVILHFLLRSKPKKLLFPALRLIVVRRKNNVRRMRLRHVWLLLLRILVIALLVLAITRPSLPAANYGLNRGELLTLAGIVLAVAAIYFGLLYYWRKKRLSNHEYVYRRTLLRGGSGVAALVLLLLLVGWPYRNRIAAEITAPMPEVAENLPVAAVFLFDTSLSMQYRLENKTRLDRARQIAVDHLSSLPPGSQVAVADTASDEEILFQADEVGAKTRIDELAIRPVSVPLNSRVQAALRAQQDDRLRTFDEQSSVPEEQKRDRYLREVYIFTDLAASGWKLAAAPTLRRQLQELDWAQVYLIDVGVEQPDNVAVSSLKLSRQVLPVEGKLFVTATIDALGDPDKERVVELYAENSGGQLVKKGQKTAAVGEPVEFPVHGLTGPIARGEVRVVSGDPLEMDDVRYFTVKVRPPPKLLVVYQSRGEALYWIEALQPGDIGRAPRRYRVDAVPVEKFRPGDLPGYAVVYLINVETLPAESWNELSRYVDSGGALGVVLGHRRIDALSYNGAAARSLLPGRLLARLPFTPPERLDLGNLQHPALRKFADFRGAPLLSSVEVNWYWRVEPADDAATIIPYSDWRSDPALLERPHGEGRVVMFTTAVDRSRWADFPSAEWEYFVFVDQLTHYLSRQREVTLNYTADQPISVTFDSEPPVRRYLLQKPDTFQQLPGRVPEGEQSVVIDDVDRLGSYRLVDAEEGASFVTGFSVNPPPGESDLTRLETGELDRLFGEGRYESARTIEELTRRVQRGRIGQEVFALVLLGTIIIFCGEHFVANRFYKAEQAPEHV